MLKQGTTVAPMLVQKKKGLVFSEDSELFEDPFVRRVLGQEVDKLKEALAQTTPEALERMVSKLPAGQGRISLRLKDAGGEVGRGHRLQYPFRPRGPHHP